MFEGTILCTRTPLSNVILLNDRRESKCLPGKRFDCVLHTSLG